MHFYEFVEPFVSPFSVGRLQRVHRLAHGLLPLEWDSTWAAILRRLILGPSNWIAPSDLHGLRDLLGTPHNFSCMKEISLAARLRVVHPEGPSGPRMGPRRGPRGALRFLGTSKSDSADVDVSFFVVYRF